MHMPFLKLLVVTDTVSPSLLTLAPRTPHSGRAASSLQFDKMLRRVRQQAAPAVLDRDQVLDSNTPEAGHIHARLDGDHVADPQRVAASGTDGRRLVHHETD